MTAVWPGSLPSEAMAAGYSEAPRMPNIEFPADTGLPIERPAGTIALTELTISMIFTSTQVDLLRDFVYETLGQATQSFSFFHPRRQEQVTVRFKGRPPYRVEPYGLDYRVSFILTMVGR
jgi:hypothetical protein